MVHIWIRAEIKEGEARFAVTPKDCVELRNCGIDVTIEKSPQRIISNDEYAKQGFQLVEEGAWTEAPKDAVIVGIKELPEDGSLLNHKHVMFGHCFKYQDGWKELMRRFMDGGGCLLDVEFMVDDHNRRVVHEFSPMAGFCGMGVGVDAWCHQQLSPDEEYEEVKPYPDEKQFISRIQSHLKDAAKARGDSSMPKIIIIGALGRCGQGAVEMATKIGFKKEDMTLWDLAETKKGGPFPEILDHDIFVNCVYLPSSGPPISPFLTKAMLEGDRKLSMIVDVSCDPNSANNPIPVYNAITTMKHPLRRVDLDINKQPMDVIAIDHLPSVLPKESSERFSEKLTPFLKELGDISKSAVWKRCKKLFDEKAIEVQTKL